MEIIYWFLGALAVHYICYELSLLPQTKQLHKRIQKLKLRKKLKLVIGGKRDRN